MIYKTYLLPKMLETNDLKPCFPEGFCSKNIIFWKCSMACSSRWGNIGIKL